MVVVGHSLGGGIAVRLAAARPELVRALVLTGAPLLPRPGRPRARRWLPAWPGRCTGRPGRRERMEKARQRYGSADYRAAQGVMREVLVRLVNERYDDALAALACPVELVWGDDDTEAPLEAAAAVGVAVAGGTLTAVSGRRPSARP